MQFSRGMLRSDEMTKVQIIDHKDAARSVMTELGEASLVHLRDMNGDLALYKRPFSDAVKVCEDMTRRTTYLAAQLESAGLSMAPAPQGSGALLPALDVVDGLLRQAHSERQEARVHEIQVAKAHNALISYHANTDEEKHSTV